MTLMEDIEGENTIDIRGGGWSGRISLRRRACYIPRGDGIGGGLGGGVGASEATD